MGSVVKKGLSVFMLIIGTSLIGLGTCAQRENSEDKERIMRLHQIEESSWRRLEGKKIFFGHQSVGFNIVDGIKDLMKEDNRIRLDVLETDDPVAFDRPVFAHSKVGKNGDPGSKCDVFVEILENGVGEKADIAFFKFCYVDVDNGTDIRAVLDRYDEAIRRVKERYPRLRIVHVTVPLMVEKADFKATLKRWLGKKDRWYQANERRNLMNEMIRKAYAGKDPIFELDRVESTRPDGERTRVDGSGGGYFELYSGYSTDGGHLNAVGRKAVAAELLILLASISDQ
jgi:lysophospholipase L1-like esterase